MEICNKHYLNFLNASFFDLWMHYIVYFVHEYIKQHTKKFFRKGLKYFQTRKKTPLNTTSSALLLYKTKTNLKTQKTQEQLYWDLIIYINKIYQKTLNPRSMIHFFAEYFAQFSRTPQGSWDPPWRASGQGLSGRTLPSPARNRAARGWNVPCVTSFCFFFSEAFLPFLINQSMKILVTISVEIELHY